jgi:hypothetical protein
MNSTPYVPEPHVLVVIEKPNEKDGQKWENWNKLQGDLKKDPQLLSGGKNLTESVWQFPMPTALRGVCCFVAMLQGRGFDSKMFYSAAKVEECK